MPKKLQLKGQVFGKLTVLGEAGANRGGNVRWRCICTCGRETTVNGGNLTSGGTISCGCGRHIGIRTHGQSKSALYIRWRAMVVRCTQPNHPSFAIYGGRGIKVATRWRHSFENFATDMGKTFRPRLSLDRIDGNLGYSLSNCRWATAKEQQRNRRDNRYLEWQGRRRLLVEWAEELGMRAGLIRSRLDAGWPVEKTLATAVGPYTKAGEVAS